MARRKPRGVLQLGPGMTIQRHIPFAEFNQGRAPQPIMCQRCADGPPAVPSVRYACALCGAIVWVSRSTEEAVVQMRAPVIWCMQCMLEQLKKEGRHE